MLSGRARIMLTTDAVGGVWRYCMELAAELRARETDILLVSMGPAPSAAQRAEAAAICTLLITDLPLDWLAETSAEIADAARALAAIAAEWNTDSIHLHTPALVPDADWPAPVVAFAHSCVGTWWRAVRGEQQLPPDLAWRAALVGAGLRAADRALAPTRAFARELSTHYGHPVRAVPNGRRPLPFRAVSRGGALTAGRLWDEGKNIRALDAAAARLDTVVRAAGPSIGPNGAAIECRALRLLGNLDEVALAREYAGAAAFISVARYEPFGLAVLEAAQSGCALVLSDIPTFRELWDGAAEFVDPGDTDAIACTIAAAVREPTALSDAARRRAQAYDAETMAAATLDIHRALHRAHQGAGAT